MHSTRRCAASRRVSIIQTRAFSAVRGSDALFPSDFGEDLFCLLCFSIFYHLSILMASCQTWLSSILLVSQTSVGTIRHMAQNAESMTDGSTERVESPTQISWRATSGNDRSYFYGDRLGIPLVMHVSTHLNGHKIKSAKAVKLSDNGMNKLY